MSRLDPVTEYLSVPRAHSIVRRIRRAERASSRPVSGWTLDVDAT